MARAHANPPLAKRLTAKGFLAQNHATFLILLIDQLVLTRENNSLIFLTTDSVCAGLMPYRVNRVLPQASTRSTVITLVIWLSVSPNYCWDVKTLDCMQTAHIYFWRQLLKSDQRAIWKSESSEGGKEMRLGPRIRRTRYLRRLRGVIHFFLREFQEPENIFFAVYKSLLWRLFGIHHTWMLITRHFVLK